MDLFAQAKEHYGHIDIVVSNASVKSFGHISETTFEEFDRVFTFKTRLALLVVQQAYKHLTVSVLLIEELPTIQCTRGVRVALRLFFSVPCCRRVYFPCEPIGLTVMSDRRLRRKTDHTVNIIALGGT